MSKNVIICRLLNSRREWERLNKEQLSYLFKVFLLIYISLLMSDRKRTI